MTEEQINIAIAESLGCKDCHAVGGLPCGIYPNEREHRALKKYTASLDACAEFEAKLTDDQKMDYWMLLRSTTGSAFDAAFATAPQRCEAYLRTIGKWEASA